MRTMEAMQALEIEALLERQAEAVDGWVREDDDDGISQDVEDGLRHGNDVQADGAFRGAQRWVAGPDEENGKGDGVGQAHKTHHYGAVAKHLVGV